MPIFRERVLPSVANLALPLLLFLSVFAVSLPLSENLALPLALMATVAFSLALILNSPTIELTETELICKGARIDRRYIGKAVEIEKEQIFGELGPHLDARAWLSVQASVKCLVKVEIVDKNDPTPYWLITSRKPDRLVKLLNRN